MIEKQYRSLDGSGQGGRVTLSYFRNFMRNQGLSEEDADKLFRVFDEDGNGRVDFFEVIR